MEKTFIIILLFMNLSIQSQNEILSKEINLDPEEYVEDIKIISNNFYVGGSKMFKNLNSDGYSTNSYLNKYDENLEKYMTSYSLLNDEPCDINLLSLPN